MSDTTSYSVANETDLNAAILAIDAASLGAPAGTRYVIDIAASFTLGADIAAINLAGGATLLITGNDPVAGATSAKLTGAGHRGFVALGGNVTLDSLWMTGMKAAGGRGANGPLAGGGGAGLGGAVFVGAGADVTLAGVKFGVNSAVGGAGGRVSKTGTGIGGTGEPGGFGAGGNGGVAGGFGGGGGSGAAGGFGAGGNAGGGLAAGGNIFVQGGGVLNFSSGSGGAGSLSKAAGGQAYGNNIFIQGNTTITLGNVTLSGLIADQGGAGGAGSVLVQGATTLSGANSYTGGTTIAGVLTLQAATGAGSGEISFAPGGALVVNKAANVPANLIGNFLPGDTIDFQGIGAATGAFAITGSTLTVAGSVSTVSLNLDPAQSYANDAFVLQPDAAFTGTLVSVIPTHFNVGSEADLNAALAEIDVGGKDAQAGLSYSISLTAGFTLGTDIYAVNLMSGDKLSIDGGGQTLNGNGQYRGLFVYNGTVAISNLTIADAVAAGGAGGAGLNAGGGGAGLGGGLFVAAGTAVTLNNVSFLGDSALGGQAGAIAGSSDGGGGGLGGAGGAGNGRAGGGGGVGTGATGGVYGQPGNGGGGILIGAGSGGATGGTNSPGAGGANGGGGGQAGQYSGSGRDPRSYPGTAGAGGDSANGAFGGGAGADAAAGFGGGGATNNGSSYGGPSGMGGWGGGGSNAAGGFGGGSGGSGAGGAGGGLGAGGAVFVQQGGALTITGGSISGGAVAGGAGSGAGGAGLAYGSGIFFQGDNILNLAPAAGQTLNVSDAIADQAGVAGSGGVTGVVKSGAGTMLLAAANGFSGGMVVNAGTVSLQAPGAAGSGMISFGYGANAMLICGAGDAPANVIAFFLPGDVIDLQGIGTATSAVLGAGDVLAVTGGTTPVNLNLFTGQIFTGEMFHTATDNHGGTLLTAVTTGNDQPPYIAGGAVNGTDAAGFAPLANVTVADLDAGQTEAVTLTLSSAAAGGLSNLAGGSYDSATGVYSVSGSAAAVTAALAGLAFTPTAHQVAPGASVTTGFDLSVTDGIMTADTKFNVSVAALNDAPVIAGAGTQSDAYWGVPIAAFAGVSITDPDFGARETVTLTLGTNTSGASDLYGSLSLAAPVDGVSLAETAAGSGIYTLTSSDPASASAALAAVRFTPTSPNPALGFTINDIGISVSDGIAPAATAGVVVYAGLPILTGTQSGQLVASGGKIDPFATAQVTDSSYFTSESVTITLENAKGVTTGANGGLSGKGLTKVAAGVYTLAAGTPAAVTAELEKLVFSPGKVAAGKSVTTIFAVSMFDGATTASNYDTTVVAMGPALAAPARMGFLAPADMTAHRETFTMAAPHGLLPQAATAAPLTGAALQLAGHGQFAVADPGFIGALLTQHH